MIVRMTIAAALAALSLSPAQAADPLVSRRVSVSDIDGSSASVKRLNRRVHAAAVSICGTGAIFHQARRDQDECMREAIASAAPQVADLKEERADRLAYSEGPR